MNAELDAKMQRKKGAGRTDAPPKRKKLSTVRVVYCAVACGGGYAFGLFWARVSGTHVLGERACVQNIP